MTKYKRKREEAARNVRHRYDLPLVFADDDADAGKAPLALLLMAVRGFFDVPASVASFITIFAWISSSFAALTFLGQNRVTNLCKQHENP